MTTPTPTQRIAAHDEALSLLSGKVDELSGDLRSLRLDVVGVRQDVTGLRAEVMSRLDQQDAMLRQLLERLPAPPAA